MLEKRLSSGPDCVEHVGVLPTGEMYVDREIAGDDVPDFALTDYVAPGDVARLKSLLSPGREVTDAELLEMLAGRFKRGADLLKWLHAAGIPTSGRAEEGIPGPAADSCPVPRVQRVPSAVSREFSPGTKFYEVEGVPVALEPLRDGAVGVSALDPHPRDYPLAALYRSGVAISAERFDQLVETFAGARPSRAQARSASLTFQPGTKFYEVERVPVVLEPAVSGGPRARAFDPTPRYFPVNAVARNGTEITRETFEDIVEEQREAHSLNRAPAIWPADD